MTLHCATRYGIGTNVPRARARNHPGNRWLELWAQLAPLKDFIYFWKKANRLPGPVTGRSGLCDLTGSFRSASFTFFLLRNRFSRNIGRECALRKKCKIVNKLNWKTITSTKKTRVALLRAKCNSLWETPNAGQHESLSIQSWLTSLHTIWVKVPAQSMWTGICIVNSWKHWTWNLDVVSAHPTT